MWKQPSRDNLPNICSNNVIRIIEKILVNRNRSSLKPKVKNKY